ncbi:hypothetical protein CKAH01_12876 [Colletotrichum kahawae]|uniref:Uncharacterized protein n=1 Tax=Colletotrichum kahawae TaxID=34407 RepID=A0AAD9YQ33_COLKA|nr:hypothetical protein CKAH01_12876 [Colletotrichum kahawae]
MMRRWRTLQASRPPHANRRGIERSNSQQAGRLLLYGHGTLNVWVPYLNSTEASAPQVQFTAGETRAQGRAARVGQGNVRYE